MKNPAPQILQAAAALRDAVARLSFSAPVSYVYNPLDYAWDAHALYVKKFAATPKRILFLGMNPGPFGMAQIGVPFGEVVAARDWLGLYSAVRRPVPEHPKRPVLGFDCPRSEVSGRRLWGLFAARFGTAEKFFHEHYVVNYCPLAFLAESGANLTPDKLPPRELAPLHTACDAHLRRVVEVLQPAWLIGIGGFAMKRAGVTAEHFPELRLAQILHPSPASPAANRDWAGQVTRQLEACGAWGP